MHYSRPGGLGLLGQALSQKVKAVKADLQQCEFQKGEIHPSTNKGKHVEAKDQDMHGPMSMKREAQSIANLINAGKAKMIRTAS